MDLDIDTGDLEDALLYVEKVTGRSIPDSLNRAGKHVLIGSSTGPGAMQLTPKAAKAAIMAVPAQQIRGFVVARLRRAGKWPVAAATLARMVVAERARRIRSIGYAAYAGWNNAVKALGGRGIKTTSDFPESEAARGYAEKATIGSFVTTLVNTAPAAERIGHAALQQGVDNAAEDLVIYGNRKLQETFNKVKP